MQKTINEKVLILSELAKGITLEPNFESEHSKLHQCAETLQKELDKEDDNMSNINENFSKLMKSNVRNLLEIDTVISEGEKLQLELYKVGVRRGHILAKYGDLLMKWDNLLAKVIGEIESSILNGLRSEMEQALGEWNDSLSELEPSAENLDNEFMTKNCLREKLKDIYSKQGQLYSQAVDNLIDYLQKIDSKN